MDETETQRMGEQVICGPAARTAILADLAVRPRIEACGLLLGTFADGAWHIEDAVPLRNSDDSAASFEFDPEELVLRDLEYGERIVGAYHSHLGGPAHPSRKDLRNMRAHAESPWIWLIVAPRPARRTDTSGARAGGPAAAPSGEQAADAARADARATPAADAATPATRAWSAVEVGAFRVDAAGTLLIYAVRAAEGDGEAGTGALEP